jgi:hypothetical protein
MGSKHRKKLLIGLILVAGTLTAAGWTTAEAARIWGNAPDLAGITSVSKPGAVSLSGDPDVGQGKNSSGTKVRYRVPDRGHSPWGSSWWDVWFGQGSRIWATVYTRAAR